MGTHIKRILVLSMGRVRRDAIRQAIFASAPLSSLKKPKDSLACHDLDVAMLSMGALLGFRPQSIPDLAKPLTRSTIQAIQRTN